MILKNVNAKALTVKEMKTIEGGANPYGFPGTPFSDEPIPGTPYTRQDFPFYGFTDEQVNYYMTNIYKNPPLRG
ncbi:MULTISPECIES: hypothetical protein [Chryseobacterium]|uniref:Bacteriocin n=3 Tax=Chryseobacterium TaxID=59732 RepID=A0A3M7TEL9_9FLAO|nr:MULTISPECIES: hypothetical protein [Chryseobacterium]RMZ59681.1 hypothetical protein D1632_08640 [Chryseobacterium nematophagum]RNA62043.1 hypothetical protein D1631_08900 [Chryseobacterium nematophagum]CAA7197387.1 hypothetical protein CHRY9293_03446 [Chryseobacterium potabilaquae]CAA7387137.1 hypothetical protein CHRY9393_01443 [Chryseobacterium fistulae]